MNVINLAFLKIKNLKWTIYPNTFKFVKHLNFCFWLNVLNIYIFPSDIINYEMF